MGQFDIGKRKVNADEYPDWVVTEKVKTFYDAINKRAKEIEALLLKGNFDDRTRMQFKINKSKLSKELGQDGSYINNHKNLRGYVEDKQKELTRLYNKALIKRQEAGYAKNKRANMKRKDAIDEVTKLENDLAKRKSELYELQLIRLIDSGLSGTQQSHSVRLQTLSTRLQEEVYKNAELESTIQLFEKTIATLQEENRLLKRQLGQ